MKSFGFHTRRFSTMPEGDLNFCNGMPGSATAEWLREVLMKHGIKTRDVIQEDYGWGFWLDAPLTIWVAVSYADHGDEGDAADEPCWIVSIVHEASIFRREWWLYRRQAAELVSRIYDLLRTAAVQAPDLEVFAM